MRMDHCSFAIKERQDVGETITISEEESRKEQEENQNTRMKFISVAVGLAVYLFLLTTEGQCNDAEHVIVEEQMLQDLAELLEVKKEEDLRDEPLQMDYPKPKPGQIVLPCSDYEYGCCQDGKTRAEGPNKKGCGEAICVDNSVGFCRRNKDKLNCRRGSADYERCTFTCGCSPKKSPKSPLELCMSQRTPFGCCWNGNRALTPGKRDCPPCRDLTPHTCRQFRYISGGCRSGSYGIRTFMQKYCPRTCGYCYLSKK